MDKLMQKSKKNQPITYKGIITGEHQSLEETIFESLFFIGFTAFFIIIIVGWMYAGIVLKEMKCWDNIRQNDPDCNTKAIQMTRMILFWSFVATISSILIAITTGILILINGWLMHDRHVISGVIVYSAPIGYFLAYNLVSLCYSNM